MNQFMLAAWCGAFLLAMTLFSHMVAMFPRAVLPNNASNMRSLENDKMGGSADAFRLEF